MTVRPTRLLKRRRISGVSLSDPATIVARTRTRAPAAPVAAPEAPAAEPAKRQHHKVDRSTANWDEKGEYLVGKGRPPKHTRWQKGQSGNPTGPKPKKKLTPQEEFDQTLLAPFSARINGEDVTLNIGTFVLNLMKSGAAKGVARSQQQLLELFQGALRRQASVDDSPEVQDWEQQVIDSVLEQFNLPARPVQRQTDRSTPNGEEAK